MQSVKKRKAIEKINKIYTFITEGKLREFKAVPDNEIRENKFTNYQWNALHLATWYNQPEIVQHLLSKTYAADLINAKDINGETPLHLSVCVQNIKVFQMLVGTKTSLDAKNKENQTPLDLIQDLKKYRYFIQEIASCIDHSRMRKYLDDIRKITYMDAISADFGETGDDKVVLGLQIQPRNMNTKFLSGKLSPKSNDKVSMKKLQL